LKRLRIVEFASASQEGLRLESAVAKLLAGAAETAERKRAAAVNTEGRQILIE